MHFSGLFVGLTTIDIQYFVDSFPPPNKKVKTKPPEFYVGGPATNAAVAYSVLNGGACLASAVGKNEFAPIVLQDFDSNGIQLFDLKENKNFMPVLASVITSANGDRNIFTNNPLNVKTSLAAGELIEKTKPEILLIDGFYPDFALECVKIARQKKIPVVADCGSWKTQYKKLLQFVDVAICSEDFSPPECSTGEEVFSYLEKENIKFAAISRGAKSTLFKCYNSPINTVDIKKVKVADTLGAGDFLHGAFCYYFLLEGSNEIALKKASEFAGFTCMHCGTRNWIKHYKSVQL